MDQRASRHFVQSAAGEGALDALRRRLLDDPRLAARLFAFELPETFIAAALEIAAAHGIALSAETLRAALQPDPLGIGRFATAPATLDRWPPRGWAPARSAAAADGLAFDWIWFGDGPPVEPFYEDSVRRAWGRPLNLLMRTRTSFEQLRIGSAVHDIPPPDGFIFHMSRCGSTLLSQMLAQLPANTVISEPEPLDAVVQWVSRAADRSAQAAALQAITKALAHGRTAEGRRLFVKLDAWHTLALPLFHEAFPDIPWIFLYRDPFEVMASQMRMPGIHTVRGVLADHLLGIPIGKATSQEEYCALALARICTAVAEHWPLGGGLLVNYSELKGGVPTRVARHFRLRTTSAEALAMASAGARHSKTGGDFIEDGSAKRAELSGAARGAVEVHLRAPYDRLEDLRLR